MTLISIPLTHNFLIMFFIQFLKGLTRVMTSVPNEPHFPTFILIIPMISAKPLSKLTTGPPESPSQSPSSWVKVVAHICMSLSLASSHGLDNIVTFSHFSCSDASLPKLQNIYYFTEQMAFSQVMFTKYFISDFLECKKSCVGNSLILSTAVRIMSSLFAVLSSSRLMVLEIFFRKMFEWFNER